MKKMLAPSVLAADFCNLYSDIKEIEKGKADLIHIDVMDGHFVPNLTIGYPIINAILNKTKLPLDVHLMVDNPLMHVEKLISMSIKHITIQLETCKHIHRLVTHIKENGGLPAVALNPSTPISSLEYILEELDMVLIMTVNPGFGGQEFIESMLKKVHKLSKIKKENNFNFKIQVDGGINNNNIKEILKAGAEIIVIGSSIFKNGEIYKNTLMFKKEIDQFKI